MKILQVIYGLNVGGAETFVYNILSELNEEKYQVDFVVQDSNFTNIKLYELCKKKGCNIYIIPKFNRNIIGHIIAIKKIISKDYDVLHIHMNALINIAPILLAKDKNNKIIIHSHSTCNNQGGIIARFLHSFNKKIINNITTINLACSKDAGEWLFGEKDFKILSNAIDIEKFKFNKYKRDKVRNELGITDEIVIGHIGRFVEVKNHKFIVDVFSEYIKQNINSKLVLVGDGPLKSQIEEYTKASGIRDNVCFVGNQQNVDEFYSSFDCLLFPSLFEGLPFVLVEAQAAGLTIISSDNVTEEINLVDNIKFISLNESIGVWVENIVCATQPKDRIIYAERMKETSYNSEVMFECIKEIYEKK